MNLYDYTLSLNKADIQIIIAALGRYSTDIYESVCRTGDAFDIMLGYATNRLYHTLDNMVNNKED